MPVPFLTVKTDCMPYDQLRFLDAWEEWGVPLDQQWEWIRMIWGHDMYCEIKEIENT